jgi:predicted permease
LTHLLQLFVDNLLPIIIVASIGFMLRRFLHLDPRPLSRTVFYASTPALVFTLLARTAIQPHDILRMMGFAVTIMAGVGLLSWVTARLLKLDPPSMSALILAATFMNAGNYGMSLNHFALGEEGLAQATLFFLASSMSVNSVGIYIATLGRLPPSRALLGLAKFPAIYAIPLALAVRFAGLELPMAVWRPVDLLANTAVPLMLLLLGMQMAHEVSSNRRDLLWLATGFRMLVSPLLAWILLPVFGLSGVARQAGLLEAAMPTAVLSSIIAFEFDAHPALVTRVVLLTTLLSPLTITPLLALLGR